MIVGDSCANWAAKFVAVASEYSAAPDGLKAWKQVIDRGYEGYVAKDGASVYEGGPTRRWLKVKQKDWTPMAAAHSTGVRA
jgi:ATP-dependent DNA ligase